MFATTPQLTVCFPPPLPLPTGQCSLPFSAPLPIFHRHSSYPNCLYLPSYRNCPTQYCRHFPIAHFQFYSLLNRLLSTAVHISPLHTRYHLRLISALPIEFFPCSSLQPAARVCIAAHLLFLEISSVSLTSLWQIRRPF